ncbi:MAG: D-alanine--D-alanine ligase [Candidatus Nitrohelix vancouverensis]|uniref:D-alanine--D-alanine ligase n=1 Tax=Candidatus Nitrohelix vancouverensis TaxID=2705534 RepID=A0A7T0C4W2_9BACT|nr:MAG: D-alanine--D-alanine ligase [Candidatus Nitrohelix vancouverensis]
MGGLSSEREISLITGKSVAESLRRQGLDIIEIDVGRDIMAVLTEKKIDLVFLALHGTYGEDGTIQGLLEYARIPYTGSGVLGSALAYDKIKSKEIFLANRIPTPDFQVMRKGETAKRCLNFPVVVKPNRQGSSLGISIAHNDAEWDNALESAFSYSDEILIEEFIDGRLLAIGMNGEQAFPIVEIKPKSGFYDYEAKYTKGKTDYICPAELTDKEEQDCKETAARVFRSLQGRGVPRIDFILDASGCPYVLEMNTIPGMTPTSLLPMGAKQAGWDFDALALEILKRAQLDEEAIEQ